MYAIRMKDSKRYFWGWDAGFKIPRPKFSQKNIKLRGFTDIEEARRVVRELGIPVEIIELRGRVVE